MKSYFDCDTEQPFPQLPAQAHSLLSALYILPGQLLAHNDLMLMGRGSRKLEMDAGQREPLGPQDKYK